MNEDYSNLIDELCENKYLWKNKYYKIKFWKISVEKINNDKIEYIKKMIEKKELTDKELKRILVVSENIKKENSPSYIFSKFAMFISILFALNSLVISISSILSETNDNVSIIVTIIFTLIALILLIRYLFIIPSNNYKSKNNEIKITCIQISIRELLKENY